MSTPEHFRMMARYNIWANTRLYDAAVALPPEDYRADRGAFFRSLEGTLNHILVADRIWLNRIGGTGAGNAPLNAILHPDLASLREARQAEDERICGLADRLDDDRLQRSFRYANSSGATFEQELAPVLTHMFNHQAHHRGQCHTILTGLGWPGPEMDLIYFLRETA